MATLDRVEKRPPLPFSRPLTGLIASTLSYAREKGHTRVTYSHLGKNLPKTYANQLAEQGLTPEYFENTLPKYKKPPTNAGEAGESDAELAVKPKLDSDIIELLKRARELAAQDNAGAVEVQHVFIVLTNPRERASLPDLMFTGGLTESWSAVRENREEGTAA